MNNIEMSVFEDNSIFDRVLVNIVLEDVPKEYKTTEMLSLMDKKLVELIGEKNTEDLFHNDFNQSYWYDEEKDIKDFIVDVILFPGNSRELIEKLKKVEKRLKEEGGNEETTD